MKLLVASITLFVSITLASAQTKPPALPAPQGELLKLVEIWNQAELKGDAAEISKLLAREFSFVGGSNRKEYLSLMKPDPSLQIEEATIDEAEIQIYDNAALVTTLNSYKVKKEGQKFEGKFLALTIWIKQGTTWQCVKAAQHEPKAESNPPK